MLVKLYPPILGVENSLPLTDSVGDAEPHIFKLWYSGYFSNTFVVGPICNVTKPSFLVSVIGPCIAATKHPYVTFLHIYYYLSILHLVVHRTVAQADPVEIYFFVLLIILVH